MEKIATENLFLLEFLVDNLDLGKKCDCDAPGGEKCVSFQFLDNAPLDVCEADFAPKSNLGADDNIKSGKSCLFSLSAEQVGQCLTKFDILVTIHKKMQPGWLPERIDIGVALISIANLFGELVDSVSSSDGATPTAKTLKDVFEVSAPTEGGAPLGKIGVYIRMSCFGKLIVTQFQMNLQDKSVLFKDKEGKSLYRYKKAGKAKEKRTECSPRTPQQQQPTRNVDCPNFPCGAPNQIPNQTPNTCPFQPCPMTDQGRYQTQPPQGYYQPQQAPCIECGAMPNAPCFSQGDFGGYQQQMTPCLECGGMAYPPCLPSKEPPCPPQPSVDGDEPPDGNYQEIAAAMGGNSLTIRVHKDRNKVEQVDADRPEGSVGSGGSEQCTCAPGMPGKKKKNREQQGQAFAMRPGVRQNDRETPFAFRVGGTGRDRVEVRPPAATAPGGAQCTELSDPDREVFVLRVGKKSEGVDKRQNLELELCTPKGRELKPLPKRETRDTQYDPLDAGPEAVEGKKGKKGGKDKKGKKGKKKK